MEQDRIIPETEREAGRFSPLRLPVLLRIPRIAEDDERQPVIAFPRTKSRWSIGLGASVLMLMVSLPWLIRWRPSPESPGLAGAPVITVEEKIDSLPFSPPRTKAGATLAFEADSDLATGDACEIATAGSDAEKWVIPALSRGTP